MIFRDDHEKWRKRLEDGIDVVEAVMEGRDEFRNHDELLVEDMRSALAWYEGVLKHLTDGTTADPAMELVAQKTAIEELREKVEDLDASVEGLRGSQYSHDYELQNAVENMIRILKHVRPCEAWKPKDEA